MKTTLEIPDALLKRAKAVAAQQGIPLREFISSALSEKLQSKPAIKPWLKLVGQLHDLHDETVRINAIIAAEFGQLEQEDLQ